MYPALIGKKIGMTQVFDESGAIQPVTVVQAPEVPSRYWSTAPTPRTCEPMISTS